MTRRLLHSAKSVFLKLSDKKRISLAVLAFVLAVSGTYVYFADAAIDNGSNAVDGLGQFDDSTSNPQPVYTKAGANNSPSAFGFNFSTQGGTDIDTVNHRFFVADTTNNRVLVFNLNNDNTFPDRIPDYVLGQANMYSNTAANTQSGLNVPRDVAYDSVNNRLYVAETSGHRVKVFDVASITNGEDAVNVLGQTSFTAATAATTQSGFNTPRSVEFDATNEYLYVGDDGNHRIMVFDVASITDGENAIDALGKSDDDLSDPQPVYTKAGGNDGPNRLGFSLTSQNPFSYVDTTNHRFFVSDSGNHRVLVYNLNNDNTFPDRVPDYVLGQSNFYTNAAASASNAQSGLNAPTGLAFATSSGLLFVTETGAHRIKVFDLSGGITNGMDASYILGQSTWMGSAAANSQSGLNTPYGLEYDPETSRLFVGEYSGHRVKVFDVASITNGEDAVNVLGQAGFTTATAANSQSGMNGPLAVAYESDRKYLYVSNHLGNKITVYDLSDGITDGENAISVLGQALYTTATAANSQSGLNNPHGIMYDQAGDRLFVGESTGNRVKVFDVASITDGENAAYVIGQSAFTTATAANTQAGLNNVRGIGYDPGNNLLYVPQIGNSRVSVFSVASSTMSNGANAVDLLGQYENSLTSPQPSYTKSTANNGPNRIGLNLTSTSDVSVDTVNHRLYVLDSSNNRVLVYELDTDNTLVDHLPDYVIGQTDYFTNTAATTQAGLSAPVSLDYDSVGNRLFVSQAHRVAVYDMASLATGMNASNVLGQTTFTGTGAATTQSGFSSPTRVLADSSSNRLFVMETGNHRITIFDISSITDGEAAVDALGQTDGDLTNPQPVFTTATANNAANANRLGFNMAALPADVELDAANHRLFVTDTGNNRVLVYNLNSSNQFDDRLPDYVIGQPNFASSSAANTQAGLNAPRGLAYDSANSRLFVSQSGAHRVSVFDVATSSIATGMNASNVLGQTTFTDASAANTQGGMNTPYGIDYDSTNGRLFVVQNGNNRVTVYNIADGITDGENAINVLGQTNFTNTGAANTQGGLNSPQDVAYESDRSYLYVVQATNNRVTVFDTASITDGENAVNVLGQSTFTATAAANTQAGMNAPTAVAYDEASDRLFVAHVSNNRVTVFDTATITDGENAVNVLGQSTFTATAAATTQAGLSAPRGLFYDSTTGRLYVPQSGNHRISIFDAAAVSPSSISGTLYASDGVTPLTGKTIALSIGGGLALSTTTTDGSGEFTLSNVAVNAGNVLTLYVDGASEKAVTVTRGSGSTLSNVNLIQNRLITRCDNSSCGLTVSNLDTGDNNGDTDITDVYTVSTQLYVRGGYDLFIPENHTFAPGAGSVTIIGTEAAASDMIVDGTYSGDSEKVFVKGDLQILNGGTFTAPTGTFSLKGDIVNSGGTFDGNGGRFVFDSYGARTLGTSVTFDNLYLNNGLVAYWNFDEVDGSTAADVSGNGNTATHVGSPTISTDVPNLAFPSNRSVYLSGSSGQYLNVSDSVELRGGQDISVSTWFKGDSSMVGYIIAKSGNGSTKDWHIYLNGTKLRFAYESGGNNWDNVGLDSVTTITTGTWYHGAFTYDHDTQLASLYLNGVLEATTTLPTQTPASNLEISIGKRHDGSFPLPFNGNIDEIRIYNRVLSDAEMLLLGTGSNISGISTTTLAANLDVDEDLSINGVDLDVSASNYSINVGGDFRNLGYLNARGATVALDGTLHTLYGNSVFYGLSKTASASSTILFQASSTQTILGPLTLDGGGSNYLSLFSTASGTQWSIDPQGTRSVSGVKVQDSNNIDSTDIEATGTDLGNNTNWAFDGAPADNPPTVSLSAPSNGATVSDSITVSATASDDNSVSGVTFYADSTALAAEDTSDPFSITWDTTGVADGDYDLVAVARDSGGNVATSSVVTVTVDNSGAPVDNAPTVSITSPTNGATVSGASVSIEATASDDNSVSGVTFYAGGSAVGSEDTSSPYSVVWDSTAVSDGSIALIAVARDSGGNYATSSTITVTVDNVSDSSPDPEPEPEQPAPGSISAPMTSGGGGGAGYSYPIVIPLAPGQTAGVPGTGTGAGTGANTGTNSPAGPNGTNLTVIDLQKFLNATGFNVASSGAGAPGRETNTMGAKTKAALIRFQKANGIIPANGVFGPQTKKTIAALLAFSGDRPAVPSVTPSEQAPAENPACSVSESKRGDKGVVVLQVQNILKKLTFFNSTPNGVFGPATESAVKRFQKANKLSQVGVVGPQTAALLEKLGCR